jgi:hypothetical protein
MMLVQPQLSEQERQLLQTLDDDEACVSDPQVGRWVWSPRVGGDLGGGGIYVAAATVVPKRQAAAADMGRKGVLC